MADARGRGWGFRALASTLVVAFLGAGLFGFHLIQATAYPSLSPDQVNIPKCPGSEPISVASFGSRDRWNCDLFGREVVFLNGFSVHAPPIATSSSRQGGGQNCYGDSYFISNDAVYGLVAAQTPPNGATTRWWGTTEGVARAKVLAGGDKKSPMTVFPQNEVPARCPGGLPATDLTSR